MVNGVLLVVLHAGSGMAKYICSILKLLSILNINWHETQKTHIFVYTDPVDKLRVVLPGGYGQGYSSGTPVARSSGRSDNEIWVQVVVGQ